jgi:hypothetical protein
MRQLPTSDSPDVVVFPPALFGGTLVVGMLLHWLRPVPVLPPVAARLLGVVLFADQRRSFLQAAG